MQLLWRSVFGQDEEMETRLEGLGQNEINQLTVARLPIQEGAPRINYLTKNEGDHGIIWEIWLNMSPDNS